MSSEWHEVSLESIKADKKNAFSMGPFGSKIKADNFVSSGVPVIKGGNLGGTYLNESEFDFLTDAKANELASSKAYREDIVITHRGTLGQVGLIPESSKYDEYVVSQSQLKMSFDKDKVDPYFVYYFLRSPIGQSRLLANTSQVGVPAIAQALTTLRKLEIPLPPKNTQSQITGILRNLDDRITLLRASNTTLEAIAQALFKSWFVDFDPVHAKQQGRAPEGMDAQTAALFPDSFEESELGMVPKGWEVKALDQIADYLNGLALQKFPPTGVDDLPVIKIAQLRKGDSVGADKASRAIKPEYIIKDGDVLFSWSGSLEVEVWCGGEGALNQHLFKVTSKDYPKWLYLLATKFFLNEFRQIAASKATTMGHIQRKHLSDAKLAIPKKDLLEKASSVFEPILERYIANSLQAKDLAELRDTLLPRLISGQLRLPEAQAAVEGAL